MVCLWKGCRSRHKALGKFSSLEKGCQGKVCSQWWGMNTGKIRCRQWKFVQQVVRSEMEAMWDSSFLDASGFCGGMLALLVWNVLIPGKTS